MSKDQEEEQNDIISLFEQTHNRFFTRLASADAERRRFNDRVIDDLSLFVVKGIRKRTFCDTCPVDDTSSHVCDMNCMQQITRTSSLFVCHKTGDLHMCGTGKCTQSVIDKDGELKQTYLV